MTDLSAIARVVSDVAFYQKKATELECYETDEWAIRAILDKEILTPHVIDVCCGPGVLAREAKRRNYRVTALDIFNWGYKGTILHDFLADDFTKVNGFRPEHTTILMNPPFSKAVSFIKRAHELKVRKIVCFQRFAWWESIDRSAFWDEYPPARVYVCGNRATCWKVGTPPEKRADSSGATAHGWFIYETGQNTHMPALGRIYDETNPNVIKMRNKAQQIPLFGKAA